MAIEYMVRELELQPKRSESVFDWDSYEPAVRQSIQSHYASLQTPQNRHIFNPNSPKKTYLSRLSVKVRELFYR